MADDLVRRVARAIRDAPAEGDWAAHSAAAAICIVQLADAAEIERLRDEINILKSQIEHDAAVINRLRDELDNK